MDDRTTQRAMFRRIAVAVGMIAGLTAAGTGLWFEQVFDQPNYAAFGALPIFHEAAFNFVRLAPIAILLGLAGPLFFSRYRQAAIAVGIAILAVGVVALLQVFATRSFYSIVSHQGWSILVPEVAVWTLDGSLLLAAAAIAAASLGRTVAAVVAGSLCGALCGAIQWGVFVAMQETTPYPGAYWFVAAFVLGTLCGLALAAMELSVTFGQTRRIPASRAVAG